MVSEIRFRTLRDPWLRDLALVSGNIDFLLENFSHTRIRSFEKKPFLNIYRNNSNVLHYIAFNEKKINKDNRKFLQESLSGSTFISEFWNNDVEPAFNIFKNSQKILKNKRYSLKNSSLISLELSCIADETNIQFLTALTQSLKSKGINLKIRPLEFATFMKTINSQNFEAYFFYVDVSHIQNLEALLASPGNRLGIKNPKIDQVFSSFRRDLKLSASEQDLDYINFEESYLIPLFRGKKILVASQNLHIKQSPFGFWKDLVQAVK